MCSSVYGHICVNQLVRQMRNSQYRQQPVNNQLVHTLMPNDAACFIKVGKLIVSLCSAKFGVRFQKRTGGSGRIAINRPRQIRQILLLFHQLHVYLHLMIIISFCLSYVKLILINNLSYDKFIRLCACIKPPP